MDTTILTHTDSQTRELTHYFTTEKLQTSSPRKKKKPGQLPLPNTEQEGHWQSSPPAHDRYLTTHPQSLPHTRTPADSHGRASPYLVLTIVSPMEMRGTRYTLGLPSAGCGNRLGLIGTSQPIGYPNMGPVKRADRDIGIILMIVRTASIPLGANWHVTCN